MSYIQLMSGDQSRDFSKVMLDFGVAIVGPGEPGPISIHKEHYVKMNEWSKMSWLEYIQAGDRIVMHSGQSVIQAVGEVRRANGPIYQYSNCFADVDGWDLQHFCFVDWKRINCTLEGRPLSRATAQQLHHEPTIELIESMWDQAAIIAPCYQIPEIRLSDLKLTDDEIELFLINLGYRIEDAENMLQTLLRVEKLAKWYERGAGTLPNTEHEIRAFLVAPLLQAIGWSHQRMGIEYEHLDVILFQDPERKHPRVLIETKAMGLGREIAKQQVSNYLQAKSELLQGLDKVIITDGLSYWLFDPTNMEDPLAYMSIKRRWRNNPAYPTVEGFLRFIQLITPH